ncbi:MAG: hypothetical protein JO163_20570 [Methylobacteriaceae bacterium]|nr:hypothetical protein [Methylobacteriaceae bacterium]MBV9217996.1 hypothetical protein [Methylobacteriaceae bacterium]MBV9705123.1 hypothetical protein [Methylobacteriaceae bacterium]
MMNPAIILVGADKGGVGKTTVTRALLDYLAANNVFTRAFDTESPRGTLARFHPIGTEVVDVSLTTDQMRIIDTLATADTKVSIVDARAGSFLPTLRRFHEMGFLDAAQEGHFTFVVFHILGPSISSLNEIGEAAEYLDDAYYFLTKNFINETSFFEWDPATYKSYFRKIKHAVEVTIPKLDEHAYEQVEVAGVPFSSFVTNKNADGEPAQFSFVLRGYVRNWFRQITAEFDRIRLLEILAGKVPA